MSFWAYMIQCGDRTLYVGHTNDLEHRFAEHQSGRFGGYTSTRHPLSLVWSQEFPSRYEAVAAERQIKGWGRAKKLALIRGDWGLISALARGPQEEGRASTSSAQTGAGVSSSVFLHPHRSLLPSEPFSLEANVRPASNHLKLRFRLTGPIRCLRIPAPVPLARRDNLWQHTCFEAFVAVADGGYFEFNFSPSTEWAAYRFTGYRAGMTNLEAEPTVRVKTTDHLLELTVEVAIPATPLRLGLSAVIEEIDGAKSYWALRHPPGDKPDFHHPDCFALELPSPTGP